MRDIVTAGDRALAREWCARSLHAEAGRASPQFPIAFQCADQPSAALLPRWTATEEPARNGDGYTARSLTVTDPVSGLSCRCEVREFTDAPAVEWVAWFENKGRKDSSLLSDIQALDTLFALEPAAPCMVQHSRGGLTQKDDFEPLATPLTFRQGAGRLELSARTGKSSTLHLPFFNLQLGTGGIIGAVGWTGGWAASFQRQRDGVRVRAGMERTHLRLRPGEKIRTPRILLVFWQGSSGDAEAATQADRARSHNMLRRLLLSHYAPRAHGAVVQPPFCEGTWGAQTEQAHMRKIAWIQENSIPTECYWIDAGWYGERPLAEAADSLGSGWMRQVGSWQPNAEAYPRGLAALGEAVRTAGLGFLLWVEPERVFEGTRLFREHREWLIGPVPSGGVNGSNYMLNLGIPEARRHITDLVSDLVHTAGLACYRQDFNDLRVPELFAMADAPDRVGMTEIGHVTGLYAFWDELLARHPGLLIDNCAGGGQRIDLETIARSVPLWRSDLQCWPFDPIAMQTQTQGLAPWVPLSAAVCDTASRYAMRSALGPGMVTHWCSQALDNGRAAPLEKVRAWMEEALEVRRYFYGDFYPLLAFSLAEDAWAAWQYDRPDLDEGMVAAFRRHASPFPNCDLVLRGLEPDAVYELRSCDGLAARTAHGSALMTVGISVTLTERPGSALFIYKRAPAD